MVCAIATQSTSKYEGISWNKEKKRWQVELDFNGKKSKYYFENKFDAIKTRNRVDKKTEITSQDTEICEITKQWISQYKGVTWHKERNKWRVQLYFKGEKKTKYGGNFKDELDAAKRVNQLCEESRIPPHNPAISGIPNQPYQKKKKMSKYKGVVWHEKRKKWYVLIHHLKREKQKYGGYFQNELDAGKRVNQLCDEFEIPQKNPEISAMPNKLYQKKTEKISQYKGVCWQKQIKKWYVAIYLKGQKRKYGGIFNKELDAAKRVNELCKESGISPYNPGVVKMSTQHDDEKTIANHVISSEISNTDNDDANKNKRKREKEFNDNEKPVKKHYFYDYLLK